MSGLTNYLLLIVCLFLLFYSALRLAKITRSISISVDSRNINCMLLVCVSLLGIGVGLNLLPAISERVTPLYLLFSLCLCTILTGSVSLLQHYIRRVLELETAAATLQLDPLTKAYNREFLRHRLALEVARCKRYGCALAAVAVDVDYLHEHNSVYGYQSGDQLLKVVASALRISVRDTDLVARYSGSVFIVVITDTQEGNITAIVDRLHQRLNDDLASSDSVTGIAGSNNVKFGNAWCGLETPSGEVLVDIALEQIQLEKTQINKQDTELGVRKSSVEKRFEEAA